MLWLNFYRAVFLLSFSLSGAAVADVLSDATSKVEASHSGSQQSQQRIDRIDEEQRTTAAEFSANERQADLTEAYNRQVSKLVSSQQQEIIDLQQQIVSIEETERAVLPMLNDMVETLYNFIANDLPMLQEERQERVDKLQQLLARADVSVAEKYRRILEAYMIEVDYGRSFEAYSGSLIQADLTRQVNFLRLGRTALYYQTHNGLEAGMWSPKEQRWLVLSGDQNLVIGRGIEIARQQRVPELLNLPLPALEP